MQGTVAVWHFIHLILIKIYDYFLYIKERHRHEMRVRKKFYLNLHYKRLRTGISTKLARIYNCRHFHYKLLPCL